MSVLSREDAKQTVDQLKTAGKTVVFTNGCFDILHIGHIRYLKEARELGDVLIVGLNSDASVKKLKGEKRPLIQQDQRAEVLDSLESVDYVVIYDENTPEQLIRELKPGIQAKGGDYTPEQVPEKKALEEYGGRLEILKLVDCDSTTDIISKL
tara:strand:+ start:111 stop:569 length:459 start_codon:yes stop_codon:yes gene_type:complete